MRKNRLKLIVLGGFFVFAATVFLLPETRMVSANDKETNSDLLKRVAAYKSWKPLIRSDDKSSSLQIIDSTAMG